MQEFNKNILKIFYFFFSLIFHFCCRAWWSIHPPPPQLKSNGVLPPMLISCLPKFHYSPFILDMLYQLPDGTITDDIISVIEFDRK